MGRAAGQAGRQAVHFGNRAPNTSTWLSSMPIVCRGLVSCNMTGTMPAQLLSLHPRLTEVTVSCGAQGSVPLPASPLSDLGREGSKSLAAVIRRMSPHGSQPLQISSPYPAMLTCLILACLCSLSIRIRSGACAAHMHN